MNEQELIEARVELARIAGVNRGITAAINRIIELQSKHNKNSSGYYNLQSVIHALRLMTLEDIEEI